MIQFNNIARIIFILFLTSAAVHAQDIITLRNGNTTLGTFLYGGLAYRLVNRVSIGLNMEFI